LSETEEASKNQKLSWEKQLLGLYVSDHPLRGYQDYFSQNAIPITRLSREHVNQNVTVGGIITKVQKVYTRNNQLMHFIVVEDGIGKIESLVFPKVLEKTSDVWLEENIILAKGRLTEKDGELKLLCENGILVDENELEKYKNNDAPALNPQAFGSPNQNTGNNQLGNGFNLNNKDEKKEITICIGDECGSEILSKISKVICDSQSGQCRVFITSENNDGRLETPQHIRYNDRLIRSLRSIVGKDNVQIV
jgi:DNA polymerase III alpha subunit